MISSLLRLFFLGCSTPTFCVLVSCFIEIEKMVFAYDVFDVHLNCIYHENKLNGKSNSDYDAYLHGSLLLRFNNSSNGYI